MAPPPRDPPRDGLAIALPVVLVALLLLGALAVVLAAVREHEEVEKTEEEVAELVRTDLGATVDELVAALAGATTIVEERGDVPIARWRLFAEGAVRTSILESLALELAVPDSERAAFEATIGGVIREAGPDGDLVEAATRASYLPVRDVFPITEQSSALLGFDIASDPKRLAATDLARQRSAVVLSEPVRAQPSGEPAFFVVTPLMRPSAWDLPPERRAELNVGFVTTAVRGSAIVEATLPLLPPDTRFTITDAGVELGSTDPAPAGDRTTTVSVAGREWTVAVDAADRPNYALAWIIGIATLAVAGAIAVVLRTRIQAHRREADDANRHARSADLAQRLAEARTTAAVAESVHHEVPPLLGASNATVRTLDDTQKVLRSVIEEDLPAPLVDAPDIPVELDNPAGRAVLDRRWVLIPDATRTTEFGPEVADALRVAGYGAVACIPLHDLDGAAAGLLAVAWEQPNPFDETTMALLRTVAELCEQTLERSRLHDSEHLLVQRLQMTALVEPPELRGLELAVRYQSAVQTLTMGGDWYDTVVLDDHTLALVVGDVAGHGVPAIAEMIELRSALHALLRARHPIEDVLAVADGILSSSERTRIASALVAVFDAGAGEVRYVSAGHPPALLRDLGGEVEVLMDGRRTVLGVPPTTACTAARRPFTRGATFVAYTDGLVERRREDLLESIEGLARRVAPDAAGAEQLAESILASHVTDEATDDDIALVIVRAT